VVYRATVDAMTTQEQLFVWDEGKALENERKHGIAFNVAATVFRDPLRATSFDVDHADSEDRWAVVGTTRSGLLLMVIRVAEDTGDGDHVRIISARRATLRERREYESGEYSIREPEMTDEDSSKGLPEPKVDDDYDDGMKAEYDMSKAKRGLFKDLRIPIPIDNEVLGYFHTREIKLGIDTTEAINEILRVHVGLPAKRTEPRESGSLNDILRRHFGLPPRAKKPSPATPDDVERR
jgi:uncharacterized DUF497 family protein